MSDAAMTTDERTVSLLELISLQLSLAGMKQEELKDDRLNRLEQRIQNRQQSLGLLRETQLGAAIEMHVFSESGLPAIFLKKEYENQIKEAAWQHEDVLEAVYQATKQNKIPEIHITINKADASTIGGTRIIHITTHLLEKPVRYS